MSIDPEREDPDGCLRYVVAFLIGWVVVAGILAVMVLRISREWG